MEKSAADYNGTFAEVSTAAKRSGGFVMSGMKSQTVGAVNSTTNVGITLKRTVAKVALQTTIDPSFADKYAGTLTINSVKLSKAASQSAVVAGSPTPGAMTFSHTQTPGKAAGEILRNGYYRVAANITGLVGQDCAVSVTVADWETPVTQNVELGA